MKELKKLKKAVQTIHLSEQEKRDGRNEFLEFMEKNPVHRQNNEPGFNGLLESFYAMTRRPLAATATLLGVFVVSASGLSYAAESTVPGDLLYPVKIHVNEQVHGFFQFDSKSKAQFEINQIQRRLEEVEALSNEGKLDVKTKGEFKQELDINTKIMEQHVEELKALGESEAAAEIESSFESVFSIHEEAALDLEFNVAEIEPSLEPETSIETTDVETDVEIEAQIQLDTEIDIILPSGLNPEL